ncbi:hypothetical protein [Paludibaculum fermentans]|uniref:Uncharacterized protein n=1 Tax=Paludibaculum fermentans TaxID=1473598 RepID=A0A7S7NKU8_PALFE|nr:hypothetical protein [Paludibaculum fermentans]QOY85518.1 hypothetical protein IRI77_22120 [Paludibaculum fermentans]
MSGQTGATFVACLLFAVGLQAADYSVFGVSNTPTSGGGQWSTELRVTNQGSAAVLTFSLRVPPDQVPPDPQTRTLAPNETLVLRDVLADLWGLSSVSGVLQVATDQPVLISAAKSSAGRYGTRLPIIGDQLRISSGQIGDSLWLQQDAKASTTITLSLETPDSNLDLILFDDAGTKLNTLSFTGGPQIVVVPVSSLTGTDLPVGRAEVRVKSGRAAGYYEVTDSTTGDLMGTGLLGLADTDQSLMLGGVVHGRGGETDVRIFNPGSSTTTVLVAAGDTTANVDVPAHGLRQLPGVLPNTLNLSDDWAGYLRFFSYTPIEVTARTTTPDSSGGLYAEVHSATRADSLYEQGAATFLPSLNAGATLLSRAGAGGATAQLSLLDLTGATVGSVNLALDPNATRADSMADLFPGVTVPDSSSMQIAVLSGAMDGAALLKAPGTGDPSYLASTTTLAGGCAPPVIDSFSASNVSLAQPGQVVLSWSARATDSVDVTPFGAGLPAAGTLSANVGETVTVSLVASNGCGTDTRSVVIAVGPPVPLSILGGTPSPDTGEPSASPGQTLAIQFDNLADPGNIDVLVLVAPDGSERPLTPEGVTTNGAIAFRLPIWVDSASAGGYRTGEVVIAAEAGGTRSAALPLNILPLSYAGDPIADFRALLDRVSAAGQTALAAWQQDASSAPIASAQQKAAAAIESSLRAMVDSIQANGSATLDWGTPGLPTVTITADNLATLLAYNANALDSPIPGAEDGGSALTPEKSASSSRMANALNCLNIRYPLIASCKNLDAAHKLADPVTDFLHQADSISKDDIAKIGAKEVQDRLRKKFAGSFLGLLGKRLQGWLNVLEVECNVQPIRLDGFTVRPSTIKANFRGSGPSALALNAQMTPDYDQNNLAKDIEKKALDRYMKELNKSAKLSPEASKNLRDFLQLMLFDFNADYDKALSDVVKSLGQLKSRDSIQVGMCDLDKFYAEKNGPSDAYNPRKSIVEPASWRSDFGDLTFWYIGRRAPAPEKFCVYPKVQNFLFHKNLELSNTALNITSRETCYSQPGISVGNSAGKVRAAGSRAAALTPGDFTGPGYADDIYVGPAGAAVNVTVKYWAGNDNALYVGPTAQAALDQGETINASMNGGQSSVTLNASRKGRTTYTSTLSGYGAYTADRQVYAAEGYVGMSAVIPPNRDGTQNFNATVTNVGGNCEAYGYFISWTDENQQYHKVGDLYSSKLPPVITASGAGVQSVQLGMTFRANGTPANSCSFSITLEIIPNDGQ